MMIMVLCGFASYMTHIGANDVVVKIALAIQLTLFVDGCCLYCGMFDVTGGIFCDRPRCITDGDIIPCECRDQRGAAAA